MYTDFLYYYPIKYYMKTRTNDFVKDKDRTKFLCFYQNMVSKLMFLPKHGIEGTLNFCYCCSIAPIQVDANVYILT